MRTDTKERTGPIDCHVDTRSPWKSALAVHRTTVATKKREITRYRQNVPLAFLIQKVVSYSLEVKCKFSARRMESINDLFKRQAMIGGNFVDWIQLYLTNGKEVIIRLRRAVELFHSVVLSSSSAAGSSFYSRRLSKRSCCCFCFISRTLSRRRRREWRRVRERERERERGHITVSCVWYARPTPSDIGGRRRKRSTPLFEFTSCGDTMHKIKKGTERREPRCKKEKTSLFGRRFPAFCRLIERWGRPKATRALA